MSKASLRQVTAIETRAYDFPWSKSVFLDCLRAGYRARVLQLDTHLAGYGIMSIGANEAHILNLCVAPEHRGRGFGKHLLDHLLQVAADEAVHTLFLEVRPSNDRAQRLYHAYGFAELGVRPDYYPASKGREDAIVMGKAL